jgi:hypothetical protein
MQGRSAAFVIAAKAERLSAVVLELRANRLGAEGVRALLAALPSSVAKLGLSQNSLGRGGNKALEWADQLSHAKHLLSLDLSHNQLAGGGAAGSNPLRGLWVLLKRSQPSCLVDLSLRRNRLGKPAVEALGIVLKTNRTLRRLDLGWNQIRDAGPLQLNENVSLVDLDLSNNALGAESVNSFATSLAGNFALRHLNLSQNRLHRSAVRKISKSLRSNKTLIGLHIDGRRNKGYVDARGFLRVRVSSLKNRSKKDTKTDNGSERHISPNITKCADDYNLAIDLASSECGRESDGGPCWICGQWKEHTFKFCEPRERSHGVISVHLDIDGFAPTLMKRRVREDITVAPPRHVVEYVVTRTLPPGRRVEYYFSSRSKEAVPQVSAGANQGLGTRGPHRASYLKCGERGRRKIGWTKGASPHQDSGVPQKVTFRQVISSDKSSDVEITTGNCVGVLPRWFGDDSDICLIAASGNEADRCGKNRTHIIHALQTHPSESSGGKRFDFSAAVDFYSEKCLPRQL